MPIDAQSVCLTPRDREILEALTLRVRVFSLAQIARTWWATSSHGEKVARDRLKQLEAAALVELFASAVHPEIPLEGPVVTWQPDDPEPNFGTVSYQLQSRWNLAAEPTTLVIATKRAANRFKGHGGKKPTGTHPTHDTHLAGVFLRFRERDPLAASSWISEEEIRRSRSGESEKLPDAAIQTPSGWKIIEFGGAYSKTKIEGFHFYCSERNIPYEVW